MGILGGVILVVLWATLVVTIYFVSTETETKYTLAPFPSYPPNTNHQIRVCECKNDWPIATNERIISNGFFAQDQSYPDPRGLSAMVPFWGQFIDHDIVQSQSNPLQNYTLQMVPYSNFLSLTRVVVQTNNNGCKEPINLNSPAIDGTTVYGDGNSQNLRSGCKLTTSLGNLLPLDQSGTMWVAGDPRVTEHAILTSIHTLWMRDHNRICDILATEVPQWTEEQRFWKARQTIVARIQWITYQEWLPALFGSQSYLLSNGPIGERVLTAEFGVPSFRMGHSMIPNPVGPFLLPTIFFNVTVVKTVGIEPLLQAAYQTHAEKVDNHIIDGLRNFMFATQMGAIGEDLITRNLFRARDVGIAPYPQLAACFGTTPSNFYQDPMLGLLSEPLVDGSSLPPTLAVILAEQFRRLRDTTSFSDSFVQKHINGLTLAQVLRDNTNLQNIPNKVFFISYV